MCQPGRGSAGAEQPRRSASKATGLLFLGLLVLYLATSGGHTTSNDEEELYYVTQGLVERRSLALPPEEARALAIPRGAAVGVDGNYYTPYGVLPSVLAMPLYLVGNAVASGFDPRLNGFITRLAVTALSAVVTAGGAAAVTLLGRRLGASTQGSVLLGLLYGVATIAWPYAKAFWSEPLATLLLLLAALAAIEGSRRSSARAWFLASLAVGLSVATRSAMLATVVPLGLYLLAGVWRGGRGQAFGRLLRQGAGFAAGFLLPAAALGVYNLVRFGSPLENGTGFGSQLQAALVVFGGNVGVGLYGLLLSPGKSVFLYSPPLLCGVLALAALWRRVPYEAFLVALLVVAQVALAAPLTFWHGDSSWGPRYLVPATPFLLLPVAAWLGPRGARSWQRALLVGTGALGLLVQVVAVLVNPQTYILQTGGPTGAGAERRWFDPAASPLLAAPRQLLGRLSAAAMPLAPGTFALVDGFYPDEGSAADLPRWTGGDAQILLRPSVAGRLQLELDVVQPEPGGLRPAPEVTIKVDGLPLPLSAWTRLDRVDRGRYVVGVDLSDLSANVHDVRLVSPLFVPALLERGAADQRALGVQVLDVRISGLMAVSRPGVPPLPVSTSRPWSRAAFGWFYDPAVPHLVDLWPWYVSKLGQPRAGGLVGCVERCALVVRAYQDVLGRPPDGGGWIAYVSSSLSEAELRSVLCASPEGRARGCQAGTDVGPPS